MDLTYETIITTQTDLPSLSIKASMKCRLAHLKRIDIYTAAAQMTEPRKALKTPLFQQIVISIQYTPQSTHLLILINPRCTLTTFSTWQAFENTTNLSNEPKISNKSTELISRNWAGKFLKLQDLLNAQQVLSFWQLMEMMISMMR